MQKYSTSNFFKKINQPHFEPIVGPFCSKIFEQEIFQNIWPRHFLS